MKSTLKPLVRNKCQKRLLNETTNGVEDYEKLFSFFGAYMIYRSMIRDAVDDDIDSLVQLERESFDPNEALDKFCLLHS